MIKDDAPSSFEKAKLYSDRGDFFTAIDHLVKASAEFETDSQVREFLKCQNLLLRLYAETDQRDKIAQTREHLQNLVIKQGIELNSRIYFTLALCSSYSGNQDEALEFLNKSLSLALKANDKEDICFAINGLALTYAAQGRYTEALREIYNLQVFFEVLELPEIRASTQILNAWILREMGKHEQALEILWQAYEGIKLTKTMAMHIQILFSLGKTYLAMQNHDMARLYLNLASKATDAKNWVRLKREIQKALDELGDNAVDSYDLIYAPEDHSVVEKKLGKIEFRNQFVLLDLLKLFMQGQGNVFSKEYLVENVWKQRYNPAVHDNKIYVTIKRLRKMIEPDFDRPKYIFRAKNGYFLNRSAKILMDKKREN
jgi:tetratricopeptide (TPR) repeat protein